MPINWDHPFRNPVPDLWDGYPRPAYDHFNAPQRAGYNPNYQGPGDPVGHKGLDLGANTGSRMLAAHPGKVHYIITPQNNPMAGYGIELVQRVSDGWWGTRYLHCVAGSITHQVGAAVSVEEQIGQVGVSGNANYPHVHFEIRWLPTLGSGSLVTQGTPLDPLRFKILDGGGSGGGVEPVVWPHLLRRGESHKCVPHLRGLLYGLGYWPAKAMHATRYGANLVDAVRQFQSDQHLGVDGIIGPATRTALGSATTKALS